MRISARKYHRLHTFGSHLFAKRYNALDNQILHNIYISFEKFIS